MVPVIGVKFSGETSIVESHNLPALCPWHAYDAFLLLGDWT
jgi:hypothetical protein